MDREKVIKGLECCKGECLEPSNGKCPYFPETQGDRCFHALLNDAYALLKAQEPRVIPYEELGKHEVVWAEVRGMENCIEGLLPWIRTDIGWFSPYLCPSNEPSGNYTYLATFEEYNKECRCWTSRPTDAQRKGIAWK